MSERIVCSALHAGECHNGFPVTAACRGIDAMPPVCMREEYCGRIYNHLGGTTLVIANALKASMGADARPVAIYQVLSQVFSMTACWEDVPKEFYDRQHPIQRRIVYATRDAAPSDDWTDDQITREWNKHIGSAQTHHEAIRTFGRAMLAAIAPRGKT